MGAVMAPRVPAPQAAYHVLGPLEVRLDGAEVAVPAGTQRALLALLLLGRGRAVPVERLYRGLWGEDQPRDPRASLHTAVARLRRTLGHAGAALRTAPPGYALDLSPAALDADRFTELHARARELLGTDGPDAASGEQAAEAVGLLRSALDLWRGPAWAEFAEGMASGDALRLEEARLAAREDLATALLRSGDLAGAVGRLEQLVEEHPLRDRAVALLVDALHRYGRTADALAGYARYRERLADELGLDPSPTLAALHERVLRQELPEPVATRPPPAAPVAAHLGRSAGASAGSGPLRRTAEAIDAMQAIPAQPTGPPTRRAPTAAVPGLVGRDDEVAAVAALVDAGGLVTVVGPGGVGKTRLTQHVAVCSGRPVCWVDLAPVRDRPGVVQAIADALGVDGPPEMAVQAALRDQPADAPTLLVLDNCEHVLNEVAHVLSAAAASSGTVLSTSRERLGLPGERVFPLGPLAVPEPGATDPDAPAVALFLERAREAGVDLAGDADAVRRAGEVCRSLDGLPLAVELGAARIGTLTLDDLAERLDRRFDLLTRGLRTGPTRHRTLRSVVDWSYELLDPEEQAVFTDLAVFPSGFDLAAVEAVLGDHTVPVGRVADVVAQLAGRSMLVRPGPTGRGRYRMLETLRQYAVSRLAPDRLAEVRRRHAQWAIGLAERARAGVEGPDEARWTGVLDDLLDDLRAAWRWTRESRDLDGAERLLGGTWRWAHWRLRADVLAWGRRLLRDRPDDAPLVAHVAAAGCAWLEGDPDEALRACTGAPLSDDGDEHRAGLAEMTGDVHLAQGDLAAAVEAYRRAAEEAAECGDRVQESVALSNQVLARTYSGLSLGDELARALSLADASRNPSAMAFARYAEGEAHAEPDPARAMAALEEAHRLAESVGNRLTAGLSLTALVALRARSAPVEPATFELFDRVIRHWTTTRNRTLLVTAIRNLVILLGRVDDAAGALELWSAVNVLDAEHPSFGEEARRLDAVLDAARARLDEPAAEGVEVRGRGRIDLGAVSALAQELCRAHSAVAG